MKKIAGSGSESGSISQRHGSADPNPDPPQNVMEPQHWWKRNDLFFKGFVGTVPHCSLFIPNIIHSFIRIWNPGWLKNPFFGIQILKFFDADPGPGWKKFGSGMDIPDPQHCFCGYSAKFRIQTELISFS